VNGRDQARQQHITDDGQDADVRLNRVPAANLPGTPTLYPCQKPGTGARLRCQLVSKINAAATPGPSCAP
jgi:hypothetical protein